MKKRVGVLLTIILFAGLAIYFVLDKREDNEIITKKEDIIQIIDFNVDDRTTLKRDGDVYIGNNLKELENNFYDIKITNTQGKIEVFLNKLWYETYGNDYIQDEYLAKICRELSSRLNIQSETEQFEYMLYKYIKDNYVRVKQNETVEEILTEKYNLKLELEDSIVKLIIRSI